MSTGYVSTSKLGEFDEELHRGHNDPSRRSTEEEHRCCTQTAKAKSHTELRRSVRDALAALRRDETYLQHGERPPGWRENSREYHAMRRLFTDYTGQPLPCLMDTLWWELEEPYRARLKRRRYRVTRPTSRTEPGEYLRHKLKSEEQEYISAQRILEHLRKQKPPPTWYEQRSTANSKWTHRVPDSSGEPGWRTQQQRLEVFVPTCGRDAADSKSDERPRRRPDHRYYHDMLP